MPLAQASLDISLSDYRNGVGQFINVVAAQRQQLSTEQGYERTRADYWRRRAALERAAGMPLADGARQQAAVQHDSGGIRRPPYWSAAGEGHE